MSVLFDRFVRLESSTPNINNIIRTNFASLSYQDELGFESDSVSFSLTNPTNKIGLIPRGIQFRLYIGDGKGQFFDKGVFVFDEPKHDLLAQTISLTGKAANMLSQAKVANTTMHSKTLGDALQAIATRNKWSLAVDAEMASINLTYTLQHNESDLSFIRRLGAMYGAITSIKNNTLLFSRSDSERNASDNAINRFALSLKGADSANYEEYGRNYYTGVSANYEEESDEIVRRGTINVGNGALRYRINDTFSSEEQALEAAQAEMRKINGYENKLSLSYAKGRADFFAGGLVELLDDFPLEIRQQRWKIGSLSISVGGGQSIANTLNCIRY